MNKAHSGKEPRGYARPMNTCRVCPKRASTRTDHGLCEYHHAKLRRYGLTVEQLVEMVGTLGWACELCGDYGNAGECEVIDHDHSCCPTLPACGLCVRGVLCTACNNLVGRIEARKPVYERALRYLNTRSHAG